MTKITASLKPASYMYVWFSRSSSSSRFDHLGGGPVSSAGSYPDTSEAGRGPERTESPECPQHPHGGDLVHRDDLSQLTQH